MSPMGRGWIFFVFFHFCRRGFHYPLLPLRCRILATEAQMAISDGSPHHHRGFDTLASRGLRGVYVFGTIAHVVDSTVSVYLQPLVVVFVLFDFFPPKHSSTSAQGMACRRIVWPPTWLLSHLQTAAFSLSRCMVMRRVFRNKCFLKSRATCSVMQFTTRLWCFLLSIIFTVWFFLARSASSLVIFLI